LRKQKVFRKRKGKVLESGLSYDQRREVKPGALLLMVGIHFGIQFGRAALE
jgi:hypothetical protein